MKRIIVMLTLAALLVAALSVSALAALAAPLPDNCTKTQGTVTCFEGPGKNQGGVGETSTTQGNTSNFSPEPQGTGTSCRPAQSQGVCG
jgi:Spy/CpxP family protein refolding chaperone